MLRLLLRPSVAALSQGPRLMRQSLIRSATGASTYAQARRNFSAQVEPVSPEVSELIHKYVQYKQTQLSIQQFTDFGRNVSPATALASCKFLRHELPIRLAHMVKEFDDIPEQLMNTKSVQVVKSWYIQSFMDLMNANSFENLRPEDQEQAVRQFTQTIAKVLQRHAPVVVYIAQGILELKRRHGDHFLERPIQYFLDRLYMSRIGIRMLIGQHVELFGHKDSPPTMIGVIDEQCNVTAVVRDAVENARFLCDQYYMRSPSVNIILPHHEHDELRFPYIPSHLYHMLFELLKGCPPALNSMRAVVENFGEDVHDLPPVNVVLVKGEQDMTIKISDLGGGIPRPDIPRVFTYLYTTAKLPETLTEEAYATDINHAPLAGFGYGLPLSRLYARYFGGDLQLISMEGYGTDAYVYLKWSADTANEVLPTYSSTAIKHYNSTSQINDWLLTSPSKQPAATPEP